MIEPGSSEEFSLALVNAALLALWPVLPGLLLGYVRQSAAARHIRPEFSLRQSERRELDRATRQYRQVCGRLRGRKNRSGAAESLRRGYFARKTAFDHDTDEIEDLQAHEQLLRETIFRLQRRPLQRLRSWTHLISSRAALGRALAAHIIGFVLLLVVSHIPEQPAWAGELTTGGHGVIVWYPFDERLFYANAVATGFAAVAMPLFYLLRWIALRREYACEFCAFGELACSNPGTASNHVDGDQSDEVNRASAPAGDSLEERTDSSWCSVLGLPASATIEEIKAAYKRLIRQNHPDRVHGMSPAFRKLAEAETQKLNAALRQALIAVPRPGTAVNRSD